VQRVGPQSEFVNVDIDVQSLISSLANYRNIGLVPLHGCASYQDTRCFIYGAMPGGSLAAKMQHLERGLTWKQRISIATTVATGLAFLHSRTPPVVHGHINAANILLDSTQFEGCITDYTLAFTSGQGYSTLLMQVLCPVSSCIHPASKPEPCLSLFIGGSGFWSILCCNPGLSLCYHT